MNERRCYLCDPDRNVSCKKTFCFLYGGDCRLTCHAEFSTPQLMSIDKAFNLTRIKNMQEPLRPEDGVIRVPDPGKETGYRLVNISIEED